MTTAFSNKNGRSQEPYLTGDNGGGNPMQSIDHLPGKRAPSSLLDSQLDGNFGYSNGNDDAASMRARPERLSSMNSQMSGRLYDRQVSREALLGPKRPRPHKIWKKKFIKVLVVGDSGLGKTTLVKTLLSTPGERLQVHDGTYTPTDQFVKDPESLCSTVTWKDEEDRVIWVYRIQDTPGYGDDLNVMNHINMIIRYINSQNLKWLELEQAKDRNQDLTEVEDPRVDVCLFCVPPHRLRPIDLRYMFELGKAVPIIPVITKADTMTIREAQNYKQEVFNRLQNPNTHGIRGKIHTFGFDKECLERAGMHEAAGSNTPPFLVIASNDINDDMNTLEVPVFWPERRYPWGTAEAFNPEHSDLLHLRALLLKEALEDICKDKRLRYEGWRKRALGGPKLGKKIKGLVLWTVLPVVAGVFFAHHGFKVDSVRNSIQERLNKLPRVKLVTRRPVAQPAVVVEPVPEPVPEVLPEPPKPQKKKGWF